MAVLASRATGGSYSVVGGKGGLIGSPTNAARKSENRQLLESMSQGIPPEAFDTKIDKMSVGPFTFYRGSAKFYYRDMQQQNVVVNSPFYSSEARTWLQADMHMANAGRFDASDGTVVFDVNDFDESFVGSYLYDVYRLAASVALVARDQGNALEAADDPTSKFVRKFANAYLDQIKALAGDKRKDSGGVNRNPLTQNNAGKNNPIAKLLGKDLKGLGANKKWLDPDGPNLLEVPDSLISVDADVKRAVAAAVEAYARTTDKWAKLGDKKGRDYFAVQDVKQRVDAGTGSLGTKRFYVRIAGSDDRLLDVKQQSLPAWYDYVSADEKAVAYGGLDGGKEREAARVVLAYKKMVAYGPDPHLGVLTMSGSGVDGIYSVRERSPWKDSLDLVSADDPNLHLEKKDMGTLAEQYGTLLASAHDRASDGSNGTPEDFSGLLWPLIKGGEDDFVDLVDGVGCAYARQAQVDLGLLK
ncbi:hypothetical protein HYH03_016375 [Edaphochlamys debaryana]|uniref:DUF2252 domain-containing protein n=1 Tax=Edaphochlamys debaryana TaxID=47281 RepID=A0A835XRU6_9CHLO|nr:hypothetical protein HYH03_016375 [Edaphochlamys debaryana]|eukprot:KAG2484894.1 hypothetical protein HYH03_016375 [Edaphochlamys debaryana]